jgi:hypothetical protein
MNHNGHECETLPIIKFAGDTDDDTNINIETQLSYAKQQL